MERNAKASEAELLLAQRAKVGAGNELGVAKRELAACDKRWGGASLNSLKPVLKAPCSQRIKLRYDYRSSSFAFNSNFGLYVAAARR
jgi:hypothetical protein